MKKLIFLTAVFVLAGCACMDSDVEEEAIVYKTAEPKNLNCDYFDGKTCYRYVRRTRQVVAPVQVMRYREVAPRPCPMQYAQAPVVAPAPCCNGCAPKVSTTREPVEVTYKKTVYTTTYEPRTTSSVEYERVPYTASQNVVVEPQVQVVKPVAESVVVSAPTQIVTPQTEVVVPVEPTDYTDYGNETDVLLNTK